MFRGSLTHYIAVAAIVTSLIISGCVTAPPEAIPSPAATPVQTPAPTPGISVEVLKAPASAVAGEKFEVSWRVNSPVRKDIPHTAVHYGQESKSEPLTLKSYPSLTTPQNGTIPADFSASIAVNVSGTTYFRAHAIIDGVNYWSEEKMITISASSATPSVASAKVTSYPMAVNGDASFTIRWEVSGGTQGDISNTAVHWGFKNGSANISDYARASKVQTGKTPQVFGADLTAPSGGGTIYFRAHAIVDGADVYSPEYQITVSPRYSGGGY
ncbi:MAG: hypothetical protein PHU34_05430 [Candidatus Methanoperedens sp.]|nr:hypothetical protein [Candidatus Methanoperedens sp.]